MSNTPHIPTASECIAILGGLHHWKHRCHEASLALVKHPSFPANARVVRGWHPKIQSQHSWVVLGEAYDPEAIIIDPVLWSYLKGHHPAVFIGPAEKLSHVPHGAGMLMDHENPPPPIKTQVITLAKKLSLPARKFLKSIAPQGAGPDGLALVGTSAGRGLAFEGNNHGYGWGQTIECVDPDRHQGQPDRLEPQRSLQEVT